MITVIIITMAFIMELYMFNFKEIPPALILGCNTPHGINVLSDYIEEQIGCKPDFYESGWTNEYDYNGVYSHGYGCGYGYSNGNGDSVGDGYGNGYGNIIKNGNGKGYGYGNSIGNGSGEGYCYRDLYL